MREKLHNLIVLRNANPLDFQSKPHIGHCLRLGAGASVLSLALIAVLSRIFSFNRHVDRRLADLDEDSGTRAVAVNVTYGLKLCSHSHEAHEQNELLMKTLICSCPWSTEDTFGTFGSGVAALVLVALIRRVADRRNFKLSVVKSWLCSGTMVFSGVVAFSVAFFRMVCFTWADVAFACCLPGSIIVFCFLCCTCWHADHARTLEEEAEEAELEKMMQYRQDELERRESELIESLPLHDRVWLHQERQPPPSRFFGIC